MIYLNICFISHSTLCYAFLFMFLIFIFKRFRLILIFNLDVLIFKENTFTPKEYYDLFIRIFDD